MTQTLAAIDSELNDKGSPFSGLSHSLILCTGLGICRRQETLKTSCHADNSQDLLTSMRILTYEG